MARRAARTIGEAGLEEVRQALATLDRLRHEPLAYCLADTDYHDALNRQSGNGLARSIIRSVHPHARASSRYNGTPGLYDIELSHAGHVAIYENLVRHDADGAARAMYDHIMTSWLARKQSRPSTVDHTSGLGLPAPAR